MTDVTIRQGETAKLGRVDGDLKVGKGARIAAESGDRVVVTGTAHFDGRAAIDCNFQCRTMRLEGRGWGPGGDVAVHGDLEVTESADLDASVRVTGAIVGGELDIGGHLRSGPVRSTRLRVGGHLEVGGKLESGDVDVGGHMTVKEEVAIANLRVGGHAEIGGGKIDGEIRVRGHLTTIKPLNFGSVKIYGHTSLPAGSSGERLWAFGKVEFEGDAFCRVIEVSGAANARGSLEAENLKVDGKLEVGGSLKAAEKLQVFGSAEMKGQTQCGTLEVGGQLVSDKVDAAGRVEVGGHLRTSRGLKAKEVGIGAGSRISGPVIGEVVEVGKGLAFDGFWAAMSAVRSAGRMTRADDIYAKEVRVDRYSQVKRIFAESVKMQSGSMADEVVYTKEVDIPSGVHLAKPPKKVDRLPDAPV